MLILEDLKTYFEAGLLQRGVVATVSTESSPDAREDDPDNPGQTIPHLTLIRTSGLGLTLEGAADRSAFQALCRARPGHVAETFALTVDSLVVDAHRPFDLASGAGEATSYRVVDLDRIGGDPTYLWVDDQRRTEYSCNYWIEIER